MLMNIPTYELIKHIYLTIYEMNEMEHIVSGVYG